MKIMKWSSILMFCGLFMSAFIPEAHAGHRSCTSFGLSFNVAPAPSYVVAPAPAVVAPAPVAVAPYGGYYYAAPAYPYYYNAPVVVEPSPSVYVQPGFSYSYWRRR